MRVVEYAPDDFPALRRAVETLSSGVSLRHRPFVDHYYAGHPGCRLFLVRDDAGEILGTLGIDKMVLRHGDRELIVGAGTSFQALQKGVGGLLFFHWLRTTPIGLVFGGSADTHAIIGARKWSYFHGVKTYQLNRPVVLYATEPAWRKRAKLAVHRLNPPRSPASYLPRLPVADLADLSVVEETQYSADLLPASSPFTLRLAPDIAYLSWRYALDAPFVHYRLFRIVRNRANAGYVILNDKEKLLMVAQADADDAATLARGIILAVVAATANDPAPREIVLVSSHSTMQTIFAQVGFRASKQIRPFVLGTARGGVELPPDTSNWLVNLDWADNGLRGPFPDAGLA